MTQISSTAANARENARASDGRFGEQEHDRAENVELDAGGTYPFINSQNPDQVQRMRSDFEQILSLQGVLDEDHVNVANTIGKINDLLSTVKIVAVYPEEASYQAAQGDAPDLFVADENFENWHAIAPDVEEWLRGENDDEQYAPDPDDPDTFIEDPVDPRNFDRPLVEYKPGVFEPADPWAEPEPEAVKTPWDDPESGLDKVHPCGEAETPLRDEDRTGDDEDEERCAQVLEDEGITCTYEPVGTDTDADGWTSNKSIVHFYKDAGDGTEAHFAIPYRRGLGLSPEPNAAGVANTIVTDEQYSGLDVNGYMDELGYDPEDMEGGLDRIRADHAGLEEQSRRAREFFGEDAFQRMQWAED